MATIEDVIVNIEVQGFQTFVSAMNRMADSVRQQQKFMYDSWQRAGKAISNGVMGYQKRMQTFSKEFANAYGPRAQKLVNGMGEKMRWFKMEMLGIMFFGMMLQKTLRGFIQPALEAVGAFDIWNTVLQMVFLPTVMSILPEFLKISDWLMTLPEGAKLAIGGLVGAGIGLGTGLQWWGQVSLGLTSLSKALSEITGLQGVGILTNLKVALDNLSRTTFGKGLGITVAVTASIIWAKSTVEMFSDAQTSITDRFKNLLTATIVGAGAGFAIGGPAGALTGGAIALSVALVMNIVDAWFEEAPGSPIRKAFLDLNNRLATYGQTTYSGIHKSTSNVSYSPSMGGVYTTPSASEIAKYEPSVSIVQNNNLNGYGKDDVKRMIDDANRGLVDDVKKSVVFK